MQLRRHESEVNKLKQQEIRHNINKNLEKEKYEKKLNENQKKILEKYVTFYWSRKNREEKKKNKYIHFNEKYDEIINRLEEIEKAQEKKKKNLAKKLLTIETNQKEFLEKEKQKNESIKKRRLLYFNTCRNNKNNLERNFTEETKAIMDFQTEVLLRQKERDKNIQLKKENLYEKTVFHQMKFEQNLKPFYKELERIKSESIFKKSKEQRRKIFKDLKRAEAEAKKREEEERLLNQKVG